MELDKYTPLIRTALSCAKENDAYAIVRLQCHNGINIKAINGKIEEKKVIPIKGIGVNVFTRNGATGFAATSRLYDRNIRSIIEIATAFAKDSEKYKDVKCNKEIFYVDSLNGSFIQETKNNIDSKTSDEIEEIVKGINKETKSLDDRLSVSTGYSCNESKWRIARSDGTDVIFNMPYSRIYSRFNLKERGKISEAHFYVQGLDLSVILDDDFKELYNKRARNTVKLVSDLLDAGALKGGHYKALLSYRFSGLNAHEAVGHAFETDDLVNSIVGNNGKLRKGEKVAPDNISFVDGPVEGIWGNQFISANGIKRKTVEFIKNGVIDDALSDVFSAKEADVGINGCGRAETYAMQPICRMSVTRMVDDNPYKFEKSFEDTSLDDIYEFLAKNNELKPGEVIVYPVVGMGGQVMPVEGSYIFNCAGIYTIEHPKKIKLYRQSIFSGNTLGTIATRAKGIGKVILDNPGVCGKGDQSAPASLGGNMFFIIDKTNYITFGGEQK